MKFEIKHENYEVAKGPVLIMGMFEGEKDSILKVLDRQLKDRIKNVIESNEFKGEPKTSCLIHTDDLIGAKRIYLLGLGKKDDFNLSILREGCANAAVALRQKGIDVILSGVHEIKCKYDLQSVAQASTEGYMLGTYTFTKFKTENKDKEKQIRSVIVLEPSKDRIERVKEGVKVGGIVSEASMFARDLGNAPSSVATPEYLAAKAKEIAKKYKMKCTIFKESEIKKKGMGGLIGVSQGSKVPPRFIILEYKGASGTPYVLVGKGITFDSGGISLKPGKDMDLMKMDMCGASAVLGTMHAIGRLKLPIHVIGLVPTCENMPSGTAQKPGDIIKTYNGKTVEVLNTDAEGRLILADALGYAQQYKPKAVIDLATLTGACVVALGDSAAALMGNDPDLNDSLISSACEVDEKLWQLPLWDVYKEYIESSIADVQNIGGAKGHEGAGTITAAMFLKEFVGKCTWAHLDIAGVAWSRADKGVLRRGATGFGVRLLTDFLTKASKRNKKK